MEAIKSPDWNTVGILGAALGATGAAGDAIGTEHLLAGITAAKGSAREALADAGATRTAVAAVLRDRRARGAAASSGADSGEGIDDAEDAGGADAAEATEDIDDAAGSVPSRDVLGDDGSRNGRLTGAAARALTTAMEQAEREGAAKFGAVHLLRALLEEDNRAVEMLETCGTSPRAVLACLDGGAVEQEDGLDPLLHATRDVLLGRSHYRHKPLWKRWLVKRVGINWASRTAWWVSMETYEQARRLGHDAVGTEHVLLAVLATHEVAHRYPHMVEDGAPDPDTRYAGSERLAGLGLDYAAVHSALISERVRLAADARPVEQYIEETTSPSAVRSADSDSSSKADPGTGPLVEVILKEETRARQLVEALAANPGD